MIDPSTEDKADRFFIFFKVILQLSLRNDLNEPFFTIRGVKLDISTHRLQNFISHLTHHYVDIQLLCHMLHYLLLSIIVQSDVNPSMLVQFDQLLDKLHCLLKNFLPLGKLKLFLEEGVVEIEEVDVFGAACEKHIPEL